MNSHKYILDSDTEFAIQLVLNKELDHLLPRFECKFFFFMPITLRVGHQDEVPVVSRIYVGRNVLLRPSIRFEEWVTIPSQFPALCHVLNTYTDQPSIFGSYTEMLTVYKEAIQAAAINAYALAY